MSQDSDKDTRVPEETEFLQIVWEQEDECEKETDERLPTMGKRAPACIAQIGTVLSLLDRMASCWWACRGGDHVVEYLCGRTASTGRAALRLMRFGFYDESLLLSRSIGEIANLLCLFNEEPSSFEKWKQSSRGERMKEFSPVKVRLGLEAVPGTPPISQERYTLLSERAAHVHPETKPQSHNILGIPVPGAIFQDEGLLVCLNELAVTLSLSTLFGALLLDLDKELRKRIIGCAKTLAEQIGGATITEIGDYHQQVLEDPVIGEELARIGEALRRLQARRRQ